MKNKIILASASPRRKELLEQIGIPFSVITADIDENISESDPKAYVMTLSYNKAYNIAASNEGSIVIGADTVVVCDGIILGKPIDENDAFRMLKMLSGNEHQVYTGVTILRFNNGKEQKTSFAERTTVKMFENDDETLRSYIKTKEPMDKAGAYGIQGKGAVLVESITGDYNNVVGLPIARLWRELTTGFIHSSTIE